MRIRRYIYTFESPLRLRASLTRLSHRHQNPFLLRLLLPLPTWHFPVPDLVPFTTMLNNIPLLESQLASADLANMCSIPVWRSRDTPLRSLYRIYEAMVAREYYAIAPEVEYFWYQTRGSWADHRIPDPCDGDRVRYAIFASIAEELELAFNWRLSIETRRDKSKHVYRKTLDVLPLFRPEAAPSWTEKVPRIDPELIAHLPGDFLDESGRLVLEAGGRNPVFGKRNIITDTGHFYGLEG